MVARIEPSAPLLSALRGIRADLAKLPTADDIAVLRTELAMVREAVARVEETVGLILETMRYGDK